MSRDSDMQLFPMFLKLKGRLVAVIGAGPVAESKVAHLLGCQAQVRVIAPQATEKIRSWARSRQIEWRRRPFHPSDLAGALLVVGATSSRDANQLVFREAQARGVLCNIVDDPPLCDFYYPAMVRREDLQIAISTSGQSPAFAQRLRRELEAKFGPEYGPHLRGLGAKRRRILDSQPAGPKRTAMLRELANSHPDGGPR
jgi:precorrin-2 dehydrogenase/sirohydrochlorin ferrochelatase